MIEMMVVMFLIPPVAAMWAMMACLIVIAYQTYITGGSE